MASNLPKRYVPKKISYFNNALVIHEVDFPIYYIECITERHFTIAGGGGSSKTGVLNQINILELVPSGESCAADLVMKYSTPDEIPDAIMTGSIMKDSSIISTRLVTGGTHATIYEIEYDSNKKVFFINNYDILKDKKTRTPEMKSVKYMPGKILTGGLDGQLHIWDSKDKTLEHRLKAHTKEIDDIDVDLVNQHIVTLARDEASCQVWDLSSMKLKHEFKKDFINKAETTNFKYMYRSCRYAYNTNNDSSNSKKTLDPSLLIACNPIPAKGPSLVYKISTKNFIDCTKTSVTLDGVMAMTVSSDGKYFAIGTRSGSVSVFEVNNLKQFYRIEEAHYNAVTNLAFLPSKRESLSLTNSKTCALLSSSIDRRIVLHRPKKESLTTRLLKIIIFVIILYFIFFLIYQNIVYQ